jgi:hypothetical protein
MYYAIMGDTNGNTPQVIGEASWLLSKDMFSGRKYRWVQKHSNIDVLCMTPIFVWIDADIVFMTALMGLMILILQTLMG